MIIRPSHELEVTDKAGVCHPTKSWKSVVKDDIKTLCIKKSLVLTGDTWRAKILVCDDSSQTFAYVLFKAFMIFLECRLSGVTID